MSLSTEAEEILKWRQQQQHHHEMNNDGENNAANIDNVAAAAAVAAVTVTANAVYSSKNSDHQNFNNNKNNGELSSISITPFSIITSSQSSKEMWTQSTTTIKDENTTNPSNNNKMPGFYITLAKESPRGIIDESDASTYDSFHCRETDFCRDSSDTESRSSFTTEGIATIDVLEYEVASSNDNGENLQSNESSSGTDDYLFASVATRAMYGESTLCSSDFADTEESDNSDNTDSELSSADYWVCVKCKNKQNNPMYRYCEKCYQIRKNHFPPRPRHKSRLSRKRKVVSSSSYSHHHNHIRNSISPQSDRGTDSNDKIDDGGDNGILIKNHLDNKNNSKYEKGGSNNYYINNNNKKMKLNYSSNINQLNSSAETSSNEDDIENNRIGKSSIKRSKLNLGDRKRKIINNKLKEDKNSIFSTKQSSSDMNLLNTNNNSLTNRLEPSILNSRKRKLPRDNDDSSLPESLSSQRKYQRYDDNANNGNSISSNNLNDNFIIANNNHNIINNSDSETDQLLSSNCLLYASQKDSGIGSAPSSQEPTSSSLSDDHRSMEKQSEYYFPLSQGTVCDELDDKNIIELQNSNIKSPSPEPLPILKISSTSSLVSLSQLNNNNNEKLCLSNTTVQSFESENLRNCLSEFAPISSTICGIDSIGAINANTHCAGGAIRSVSTYSGRYLNNSPDTNPLLIENKSNLLKLNKTEVDNDHEGDGVGGDGNGIVTTKTMNSFDYSDYGSCIVCLSAPKNGVFVHSRFVHLCCCYKCAVKIWNKRKRCPICNCTVKNVMKLFVH